MLRRSRPVLLCALVAGAACATPDDVQNPIQAIQSGGPPDALPGIQNVELPFHYPAELYAQQVQADVTLRLFIDSTGRVITDSIRVETESGNYKLDSAAVTGARELLFTPAMRGGRPMAVSILLPVHFRHPDLTDEAPGTGAAVGVP